MMSMWEDSKSAARKARRNQNAEIRKKHNLHAFGFFVSRGSGSVPYVVQLLDENHATMSRYVFTVGDILFKIGGIEATEYKSDDIDEVIAQNIAGKIQSSTTYRHRKTYLRFVS